MNKKIKNKSKKFARTKTIRIFASKLHRRKQFQTLTQGNIMDSNQNSQKFTYDYPHPALTADCVIFGFDGNSLNMLLIERDIAPYKGQWALPGGFMKITETIEDCARRELREETQLEEVYLEQFHTFSSIERDPRERVVTVGFIGLVRKGEQQIEGGSDADRADWFPINELPPLAFDHKDIIDLARIYLRDRLKLEPMAFKLLDRHFKMSELQRLYEIINETTYDRRNFSRKMLSSGFLNGIEPIHQKTLLSKSSTDPIQDYSQNTDVLRVCEPEPQQELSSSRSAQLFEFNESEYKKEKKRKFNLKNPFNI